MSQARGMGLEESNGEGVGRKLVLWVMVLGETETWLLSAGLLSDVLPKCMSYTGFLGSEAQQVIS